MIERYFFRSKGKTIVVDFDESGKHISSTSFKEADIQNLFKKAKDKLVPKTSSISKDILKGSEVFADAERKIRMFLRNPKGRNIFILGGMPGVGKSVACISALNKECGKELSSSKLYKMLQDKSFDTHDFETRLKAFEAISKAQNLYKRYLHNITLSQKNDKSKLIPIDPKEKALAEVQKKLRSELFGYKLTIEDVEGSGEIHKSASDIIAKLKDLGGEKAFAPFNAKNGWFEMSQKMNNEELFLKLYEGNSRTIFVDEGDYFIAKSNPLMKVAFNNQPVRKISIGNKGYAEVQNRIIPDEIMYSGKLIVTTNLPGKEWDQAIKSRSDVYLFYLTLSQLFDRLGEIIPAIQKKDLPHLPVLLLTGMKNTLMRFAKAGELTTFDFRSFISLCDEFALILEDELDKARESGVDTKFSIYGSKGKPLSDAELKVWRDSPEGKSIWAKASAKFKKTLLNQIQQMNRAEPSDKDPNVIEFIKDGTND